MNTYDYLNDYYSGYDEEGRLLRGTMPPAWHTSTGICGPAARCWKSGPAPGDIR